MATMAGLCYERAPRYKKSSSLLRLPAIFAKAAPRPRAVGTWCRMKRIRS